MVRSVFVILLGTGFAIFGITDSCSKSEISSSVSVALPSNVRSETVQIAFYLVGPFGGRGGYIKQQAGLHSYEIAASVEGKAATEIRMIVYATGCEIQTFAVPLADDSKVKQEFECQPVPSVMLSGQIVPNELVRDKNAELIIIYLARWSHKFFGIVDGAVVNFQVATVSPDASGMFQASLPQFSADAVPTSSQPTASLRLILRDAKTWNSIASNLEPEIQEFRSEDHSLRIRSYYPSGLKFTALRYVQVPGS